MNDTLHNKKTENGILKALQNKEGNITTNLKQKADTLNDYFADVGKSLHDKLTSSNFLPIYSTNRPLIASNYRPISILSCISKIEQSLICERIMISYHKIRLLVTINLASKKILVHCQQFKILAL